MSATSQLLQQHIGTVQLWIISLNDNPNYIRLKQRGCVLHNGVLLSHAEYHLELTPSSMEYSFCDCENLMPILWILSDYRKLLADLPRHMIQHACELDQRMEELEELLVREQLVPDGGLWLRDGYGIRAIEVKSVQGYVHLKMTYKDPLFPEPRKSYVSRLSLFSTKLRALDPRKDGRYDFN